MSENIIQVVLTLQRALRYVYLLSRGTLKSPQLCLHVAYYSQNKQTFFPVTGLTHWLL